MIVIASFVCALIPAALFILNLWFFREPAIAPHGTLPQVDVLIPARDEADNIKAAIESVFTSKGVTLDVWVYDDNSTDATAAIVEAAMAQNPRVHLLPGLALPEGWNGKQHACWQLAQASRAPLLLFLDADVRLEGDAIARCVAQQQRTHVALLSGFPRVVTVTWMEWLVLPLIQFVLLGLLPIFRMRQTLEPAYAAGCGQFMLAERSAYFACGGHAAIRATRHDGLKLPHLFREHGFRTDICDLTDLAHTRMYYSASGCVEWLGEERHRRTRFTRADCADNVAATAGASVASNLPTVCLIGIASNAIAVWDRSCLRRTGPLPANCLHCRAVLQLSAATRVCMEIQAANKSLRYCIL